MSTPKANKRSMLYLVSALAGGNYISMALHMVGGVLLGRFVEPTTLGIFGSISLILGYAPFLQLGILNGLNRELPYYIGKGDHQRVEDMAAAGQAWALVVGCTVGVGLLCVSVWQVSLGRFDLAAGWLTHVVLVVLLFYNTYYLQMTYRTSHDFSRLAVSNVAANAAGVVLIAFVYWFGFYGLCLRVLLVAGVSVGILSYYRPIRVAPRWNTQHLMHLLKIGAPIFGVGQLYAWWQVLCSTLVLHYMGVRGMGLYAMVAMATTAMNLIPAAIGQVVYPRMAEKYGQTGKLLDLYRMAYKPTLYSVVGMIPLVALACLLVEPAVRILIPKYVEAVPAMRWGMIWACVSGFAPIANIFNVVKRQDLYVLCILSGMVSFVGSLMLLLRNETNLASFSLAMFYGRVVFVVACYCMVYCLYRKDSTALKLMKSTQSA